MVNILEILSINLFGIFLAGVVGRGFVMLFRPELRRGGPIWYRRVGAAYLLCLCASMVLALAAVAAFYLHLPCSAPSNAMLAGGARFMAPIVMFEIACFYKLEWNGN